MNLPASFYRAEAAYYDIPDEEPLDEQEWCDICMNPGQHDACMLYETERTCYNPECKEYRTVWLDYDAGDPCESCNEPLGREKEKDC